MDLLFGNIYGDFTAKCARIFDFVKSAKNAKVCVAGGEA